MKNITYISAGAGSGKTHTLTHTLVDLFENDSSLCPEQVIMTTFSRKAAAELKNKTRKLLCERGLYDIASCLDQALIGTVHSVGVALIKKYWFYLGVSPKLDVLDEKARKKYVNSTLGNTATEDDIMFFEGLTKYYDIKSNPYKTCQLLDWRENLADIIEKMHCFDATDLDECCKRSLDMLDDAYAFDSTDKVMTHDELKTGTKKALVALLNHCDNVKKTKKCERIKDFCRETISVINSDAPIDIDFFRTKVLDPLKEETFGAKSLYEIPETLDLAEEIKKTYYFSPESLDKLREYVKRIFRIAKTWKDSYLKYKDEHHVLDFNDIERKTHQLLNMPEVRADIQSTCRYLMVDEFQDSNSEQIKIFKVLADLVEHSWWVGDSKQAIYAFRGSNTELVDDTVSAIIKDVDGCDRENLPDSHRSVPELVKFANDVFSIVFAGQQNLCLNAIKPSCPDVDPLKWYSVPTKDKSKVNAEYIADMVAAMVTDSNYRKAAPMLNDFAILTRWNADIPKIADALRARGIPSSYKVPVSNSREWRLVSALLSLCDNDNLLARAKVAHLVVKGYDLIGIIESKLDYDQHPQTGSWLDDVALISATLKFYKAHRHLSVGTFVKCLIRCLGLERYSGMWKDGNPMAWNGIIALVQSYESSVSVGEVPTLRGLIDFSSKDKSHGDIHDAVQIMTYHDAKGLQWPVTILLSLDDDHISPEKIVDKEICNVSVNKDPVSGRYYIRLLPQVCDKPHPAVMARLDKCGHTKTYAERVRREESRLLYVGVTRASHQLVLVTHADNGCYNWFAEMGILPSHDLIPTPEPWTLKNATVNQSTTSSYHPCASAFVRRESLYISPSQTKDNGAVELLENFGERFSVTDRDVTSFGTCVHQIYCGLDRNHSIEYTQGLLDSYGVKACAFDIVEIWDKFVKLLTEKYGEAVSVNHELAFKQARGGQIITGSIDYVWNTTEGCVLIDYKTFPGKLSDALNPKNAHYAGLYKGQLDCYTTALEKAGRKVIDRLIFYPSLGLVVRVE